MLNSRGSWKLDNTPFYRPTWVEIDQKAFLHNLQQITAHLKPKTKILAVVKANAYGHCAPALSKIALRHGVSMLGVSSIEEALELRRNGIRAEILILGSLYPLENIELIYRYALVPTVSSLIGLRNLAACAKRHKTKLRFHLKVDTGMGRIGVSLAEAKKLLNETRACKDIMLEGIYTHFAVAGTDAPYTAQQLRLFHAVVAYAHTLGLRFSTHAANSAALLRFKKTHFDLVRPGLILYGLYPFKGARKKIDILPVLSWKTRVSFLKKVPRGASISYSRTFIAPSPRLVATLPVGYADGYPRSLSNKAEVLVRGKRCRVLGRVTMDMIMVDVTQVPGIAVGDEAVLIGRQGTEKIRAEELANIAKTINYEITCGISYRVPRVLV